jgi:hypothetical protein
MDRGVPDSEVDSCSEGRRDVVKLFLRLVAFAGALACAFVVYAHVAMWLSPPVPTLGWSRSFLSKAGLEGDFRVAIDGGLRAEVEGGALHVRGAPSVASAKAELRRPLGVLEAGMLRLRYRQRPGDRVEVRVGIESGDRKLLLVSANDGRASHIRLEGDDSTFERELDRDALATYPRAEADGESHELALRFQPSMTSLAVFADDIAIGFLPITWRSGTKVDTLVGVRALAAGAEIDVALENVAWDLAATVSPGSGWNVVDSFATQKVNPLQWLVRMPSSDVARVAMERSTDGSGLHVTMEVAPNVSTATLQPFELCLAPHLLTPERMSVELSPNELRDATVFVGIVSGHEYREYRAGIRRLSDGPLFANAYRRQGADVEQRRLADVTPLPSGAIHLEASYDAWFKLAKMYVDGHARDRSNERLVRNEIVHSCVGMFVEPGGRADVVFRNVNFHAAPY